MTEKDITTVVNSFTGSADITHMAITAGTWIGVFVAALHAHVPILFNPFILHDKRSSIVVLSNVVVTHPEMPSNTW